jgi:hypothetical protein
MKRTLVLLIPFLLLSLNSAGQTNLNHLDFSHSSGFYNWNFVLKISSKNGDTIRFTRNGTVPNAHSNVFNDSLPVTILSYLPDSLVKIKTSPRSTNGHTDKYKANILRVASFKNGVRTSQVYNQSYFVGRAKSVKYPNVPIISLITDPDNFFNHDTGIYVPGVHYQKNNTSGNYAQKGMEWERPAHFQFFDTTGTLQFEQNLGVRINGRIRRIPQKSLRLCARNKYDKSTMEHPFFGSENDSIFKKLILRNSMGCWQKTLFKDQLTSYICRDLDFESSLGQPVVVFINGEYWGIHAIREYFNDNHLSQKLGVSKDSINIVKHDFGHSRSSNSTRDIEEGSGDALIEMYAFLNKHDLSNKSNYNKLQNWLDLSSIIDYYCAEIFFNNADWPGNNNTLWSVGKHGKWRQAFYDLDAGWMKAETNTIATLLHNPQGKLQNTSKFLFQKLMESAVFRTTFAARMAELLKNEFSEVRILNAITKFEHLYDPLIQDHIYRWEIPGSTNQWKSKLKQLRAFATSRQAQIIIHFKAVFGDDFTAE